MLTNLTHRLKAVYLKPEDVLRSVLLTGLVPGTYYRRAINLPKDTVAVGFFYEERMVPARIAVVLESAHFDEVPEGEIIPTINLVCEGFLVPEDAQQ